eukprot:2049625-Prymnesium_polylepis.1
MSSGACRSPRCAPVRTSGCPRKPSFSARRVIARRSTNRPAAAPGWPASPARPHGPSCCVPAPSMPR